MGLVKHTFYVVLLNLVNLGAGIWRLAQKEVRGGTRLEFTDLSELANVVRLFCGFHFGGWIVLISD